MTDPMQGILAEAKKNKFSQIKDTLSEDDVANVWEGVSNFIEKIMSQQKGVVIPMLGTFTFTQKKLDIGNNKFIMMQRPIFMLSEKFSQTHGLQSTKYHVPGNIPVVQLNFAAMSIESPFDRDTIESCIKEILGAVSRAVNSKKNVELTFTGIGRLTVRDNRVKMRFYKEFINQMDGSGKLLDSMQNRPGTVDSVMSDRVPSRPASSTTVILPKISNTTLGSGGGLAPVVEQEEMVPDVSFTKMAPVDALENMQPLTMEQDPYQTNPPAMNDFVPSYPTQDLFIKEEGMEGPEIGDMATSEAIRHIEDKGEPITTENLQAINVPITGELEGVIANDVMRTDYFDTERILPAIGDQEYQKKPPVAPSRSGSRLAMPMAKATGVSLLDDLVPSAMTPKSAPSPGLLHKSMPSPVRELSDGLPQRKSASPRLAPLQRSQSWNAGLEATLPEQAGKPASPTGSTCGHPNAGQELCYLCHQRARRNVPVSFTEERKRREDEEDKLLQQFQYMRDAEDTLKEQENGLVKRHDLQKMAAFNLGVAEAINTKKKSRDLDFHRSYIFQRRPLTPPRIFKQQEYSKDLAGQVNAKDNVKQKRKADEEFLERLEQVQLAEDLAAQREQFIKEKQDQQNMYKQALEAQLKFKPLQVPPREPDNEVFGKHDMNNEKMAERRQRAYELFREQQDLVAQRKREAILKRLTEQKEEESVLERTKKELLEDRSNKFQRRAFMRKRLEKDWAESADQKREREMEERLHQLAPGTLLHEQCDKYSRCKQCKRKLKNCGESNIWSESRYIPGSRLMV